jgi:hypothetical protein
MFDSFPGVAAYGDTRPADGRHIAGDHHDLTESAAMLQGKREAVKKSSAL